MNLVNGTVITSHMNIWMYYLFMPRFYLNDDSKMDQLVILVTLLPIRRRCKVSLWTRCMPEVRFSAQLTKAKPWKPQDFEKSHGQSWIMSYGHRKYCSNYLITIELWRNHVFVVMAVAADGLVPLYARASADTVMAKFRCCICSQITPEELAGDVSVNCVTTDFWLMITHLTFQYGSLFQIL